MQHPLVTSLCNIISYLFENVNDRFFFLRSLFPSCFLIISLGLYHSYQGAFVKQTENLDCSYLGSLLPKSCLEILFTPVVFTTERFSQLFPWETPNIGIFKSLGPDLGKGSCVCAGREGGFVIQFIFISSLYSISHPLTVPVVPLSGDPLLNLLLRINLLLGRRRDCLLIGQRTGRVSLLFKIFNPSSSYQLHLTPISRYTWPHYFLSLLWVQ